MFLRQRPPAAPQDPSYKQYVVVTKGVLSQSIRSKALTILRVATIEKKTYVVAKSMFATYCIYVSHHCGMLYILLAVVSCTHII